MFKLTDLSPDVVLRDRSHSTSFTILLFYAGYLSLLVSFAMAFIIGISFFNGLSQSSHLFQILSGEIAKLIYAFSLFFSIGVISLVLSRLAEEVRAIRLGEEGIRS